MRCSTGKAPKVKRRPPSEPPGNWSPRRPGGLSPAHPLTVDRRPGIAPIIWTQALELTARLPTPSTTTGGG